MFIVFTHVYQFQLFWYVIAKIMLQLSKKIGIAFAIFNRNQVEKLVTNVRYFS
jgi:hypothetical protein